MRPRLNATSTWQIESYGRRTGRSFQDAHAILVDRGFRSETGTTAPAVQINPTVDDGDAAPGRTLACHVSARMVEVIEYLAAEEKRSISYTLKNLVRESLVRRDLWRPAKAPQLRAPADTASPSAAV